MAQSTVATNFDKAADIGKHLSAQVSFNLELGVNDFAFGCADTCSYGFFFGRLGVAFLRLTLVRFVDFLGDAMALGFEFRVRRLNIVLLVCADRET